jgi:hypothetical protein
MVVAVNPNSQFLVLGRLPPLGLVGLQLVHLLLDFVLLFIVVIIARALLRDVAGHGVARDALLASIAHLRLLCRSLL